jgi:copper oxidase (laccase) domain-containing protein
MSIVVAISITADGSMLSKSNDAQQVIDNRIRFLATHGITADQTTRLNPETLRRATQAHETNWCRYVEVNATDASAGMYNDDVIVADAIVTRGASHCLLLPVADCVGTAIYDPIQSILMLTHLGRHSLEQNGGQKSVEYLQTAYGCDPAQLRVWCTPAPNKHVFPIWALDNRGMKEIALEQLQRAGIMPGNVTDNPADTATDLNYFSYSQFLKGHRPLNGDHAIIAMMQSVGNA